MMIKTYLAALAATALLALAIPAFAQESEEVSDAVDQALWCGGLFATITQIDSVSDEDKALAQTKSEAAFTEAATAMQDDGIDPSEYERLIKFYTDEAIANLTDPNADMRYTAQECDTLIGY